MRAIFLAFSLILSFPVLAAINRAPIASSQSVTTNEDTAVTITLSGHDPEGAALSYSLSSQPRKGALSCSKEKCTYTPNANLNGADYFTFTVSDGALSSRQGRVSITINPVNDAPTVADAAVSFNEDSAVTLMLEKNDVDGDALTLVLLSQPTLAAVTLSGDAVTVTPQADAHGSDSFTFTASDGKTNSAAGTVSLTINAVNDAPTVSNQDITTEEDAPVSIDLAAADVDGDALTVTLGYASTHGTVTTTGIKAVYTPNPEFSGADSFTYRVSDGSDSSSQTATVTINVAAVNDPPVAADIAVEVEAGKGVSVSLSGSDVEGDALSFLIEEGPAHGSAVVSGSTLTYTADRDYSGGDQILFVAHDGQTASAPASVSVQVTVAGGVVPLASEDLEPLTGIATVADEEKIVITMASHDVCYEFMATPLILPLQLADGTMTEVVSATLHSKCGGYVDVENYGFLIRTDTAQAYRFTSESELSLEPDAQATAFFVAAAGMLVTPLSNTAFNSEDPDEPTGGLMIQQDGATEYIDPFEGRATDASLLVVDGVIPVSTQNTNQPTCQTGKKINAELCGIWGFIAAQTRELIDSALFEETGYEAWYSAAQTRTLLRDGYGNVIADRLAWGTGPGGNNWDALDVGGACSAYLTEKQDLLDAVFTGGLAEFDFFAADLAGGAVAYDPGDAGCVDSSTTLKGAIQGEITVGFHPDTGWPVYWVLGSQADVAGASRTRVSRLDEDFNHACDAFINSGADLNPFSSTGSGAVVARDGTAYINATYFDDAGVKRTGIFAIDPRDCAVTAVLELNANAIGGTLGGVTLAVTQDDHDVVLAGAADVLYVQDLDDGQTFGYTLGSAADDRVLAGPVIDGAGRVIVMSAGNVMTILPDLGLSYGDHFWPRFRKDNFGTATVEMVIPE